MPRIAGHDIPDNKKVKISLRYVYGVGPKIADEILKEIKIDPEKRARDLTSDEVNKIQRALDKHIIEGDLRRIVSDNLNRLKRIKCYRGIRHIQALPSRGQRTRSNARTRRGSKRRTVGAMTKEMAAKLDAAKKTKATIGQ